MKSKFSIGGDINKFLNVPTSVSSAVQLILTDVALLVQNTAKLPNYAPFLTGNLRGSITTDFDRIQQGFVVVGSPVKYARVREYVNNLHPNNRYYLKRAYEDNEGRIKDIIQKDLHKSL